MCEWLFMNNMHGLGWDAMGDLRQSSGLFPFSSRTVRVCVMLAGVVDGSTIPSSAIDVHHPHA